MIIGAALYGSLVSQASQYRNRAGASTNETRIANCSSSALTTSSAVPQDIVRHGRHGIDMPGVSPEEHGTLQAVAVKRSGLSSSVSAMTQINDGQVQAPATSVASTVTETRPVSQVCLVRPSPGLHRVTLSRYPMVKFKHRQPESRTQSLLRP